MDKDQSTDDVIDWIYYLGGNCKRYNVSNDIESKSLFLKLNSFDISQDVENGWIRKTGRFILLDTYGNFLSQESFELSNYYYIELGGVRNFITSQKVNWINDPKVFNIPKIDILNNAIKFNINIPETYILNRKSDLKRIYNLYKGEIITKSIVDVCSVIKNNKIYAAYTLKISMENIDELPEIFFPSLIQNYIEKEFEIRSFFLNGKFSSMAIFSQNDKQTKIDYRNYNFEKPNRCVPYKLPKELETKLLEFLNFCSITTGSIDLIKAKDGGFYFLEINQAGQFGMTSYPCNYKLEKLIANSLINKKNEITK
jgi:ATP-GRASP peptide maturase of grasp-with-spasm system